MKSTLSILRDDCDACRPGLSWFKKQKSPKHAWEHCKRGEWMLFILDALREAITWKHYSYDPPNISWRLLDQQAKLDKFYYINWSRDRYVTRYTPAFYEASAKLADSVRKHYKWSTIKKLLAKLDY